MKRRTAVVAVLAFVLSACASHRGVQVGSDNSTSYRISVHNTHSSTVSVSYTDSRGTHELGDVEGGKTVPFTIVAPSTTSVEVMGMSSSGGHYTKSVTLSTGSTISISL